MGLIEVGGVKKQRENLLISKIILIFAVQTNKILLMIECVFLIHAF
jgi:hypothetical protein